MTFRNSQPTRRRFIRLAASGAAALSAPFVLRHGFAQSSLLPGADAFTLGVASGSPAPDGFVLWTRLAPDPLSSDADAPGGMRAGSVDVAFEIAADEGMRTIVRQGLATAEADYAHSVHLQVEGLQPARPYWYRFRLGDAVSRIGRAITTPAYGSNPNRLHFGFASCSNYEAGYFSAYRHLADENPDLVVFLGDYIYEGLFKRGPTIRPHSDGVVASTLPTYRNRYAQYRLDPDLQRLHAVAPSLVTWDDHEVQNDYADSFSETFTDPESFLARRAAAYQAYYEHMPLKPGLSRPNGPSMRIYDRVAYGNLVEFSMLDGRQYRSREACYGPPAKGGGHLETASGCPELLDRNRSMLGADQENWLFDGLARSQAQWNVLAQDVLMARLRESEDGGEAASWTDVWDGYAPSRQRLLQHIHDSKVRNPVVLSGDIHSFWANDLMLDFDDSRSPVVATELVGTSISSPGPDYEQFAKFMPDNPHVKFFESRIRGYVSVQVSTGHMDAKFRAISDVADPDATVSSLKTFVVESGRAGAVSA